MIGSVPARLSRSCDRANERQRDPSREIRKVDPGAVSIRWTISAATSKCSTVFPYDGGEWTLYFHGPTAGPCTIYLLKEYGDCSRPFRTLVEVESVEAGRIVRVPSLSQVTHFSTGDKTRKLIWEKEMEEILATVPEYRLKSVLKLLIVLKPAEGTYSSADVKSQTEHLHLVTSTSVQTEYEAAGQSSRPTASTSCQTTQLWNNPDCLESLSSDFFKLLEEGSDPDVMFQCSGGSIAAHGAIVSARSEVFKSMLPSDLLEGRSRVIEIPDVKPDVFQHVLRYIYTGTLPDLTPDLAVSLYEAGDRYSVMGLVRRCAEFLLEHLTVDNACGVLSVAHAHSDKDLKEAVLLFMADKEVPRVASCWTEFCDVHPSLAVEVLNRCYIGVTN